MAKVRSLSPQRETVCVMKSRPRADSSDDVQEVERVLGCGDDGVKGGQKDEKRRSGGE